MRKKIDIKKFEEKKKIQIKYPTKVTTIEIALG